MASTFAIEVADELNKDRTRLEKIIARFVIITSTEGLTADEHEAVSDTPDTLQIILSWNR